MVEYMTELAYMRWFRQYQTNLGHYMDVLDHLRLRIDSLPHDFEGEEIQNHIDVIDEKLEQVIPRLFTGNGKSLVGFEIFVENIKVFVNLIVRLFGKPDRFSGIYYQEKIRVLKIHQTFKFKDKLREVQGMIEALEEKHRMVEEAMSTPEPAVAGEQAGM